MSHARVLVPLPAAPGSTLERHYELCGHLCTPALRGFWTWVAGCTEAACHKYVGPQACSYQQHVADHSLAQPALVRRCCQSPLPPRPLLRRAILHAQTGVGVSGVVWLGVVVGHVILCAPCGEHPG